MPTIVQQFINYFGNLSEHKDYELGQLYAENIIFKDPIHKIEGLDHLKTYFTKLNKNVLKGGFAFHSVEIVGNKAFLEWTMQTTLKMPPKKKITAQGISVLAFDDKIATHRDYFDAGELFYENIPLLGFGIKMLKKTL